MGRSDEQDTGSSDAPRVHPAVELVGGYSWRLLALFGVIAVAGWVLAEVRVIVVALAIAGVVARVLEPLSAKLRGLGVHPLAAVAISFVALLGVVGTTGWFVGQAVADEFADIGPTLEEGWQEIDRWIVEDSGIDVTYEELSEGRSNLLERASSTMFSGDGSVTRTVAFVAEIPTAIIIGLFVAFFAVKDQTLILGWFRERFPEGVRPRVDAAASAAWVTLGGFLRGAAILGVLEAAVIGLAVWLVGGSLVAPIMVLTFAAAFVPIVGAVVAGVVAVLVTLVSAGPLEALIIGVVAIVVQQLDGDLLAPVIYGRLLRLHPVVIVLAVVAGGSLLGLLGAVLAVPLVAIAVNATAAVRGEGDAVTRAAPASGGHEGAGAPR